jgi:CSLREA domain-containing protein
MNRQRSASLVLALILAMASGPSRAHNLRADCTLAVITVNSTADVAADDGQCTLREAIVAANTDTASGGAVGECAAGLGDDTINLTGITGTINLTGPLSAIASNMAINGPGESNLTVRHDVAGVYRIFTISVGATVTLSGLIISDGYTAFEPGGGIYNAGTLALENITIGSNHTYDRGGGICNTGTLTLNSSIVSSNSAKDGGGIYNTGILTLTNSAAHDNDTNTTVASTGHGAGIYNAITGTLTLSNSSVSSNIIVSAAHDGYGGGIYNAGTLTVNSSTVFGNSTYCDHCHGGGIHNEGTLTLNNSTVRGNNASAYGSYGDGGGIHNVGSGSSATLNNCTVSSNESLGGGSGGGLWNSDGANMQLSNSTVASNWSSNNGGGINNTGNSTVTLANSTIGRHNFASGSGGGMWNDSGGTVNLKNSIVAGNGANSAGPDCHNTATLISLDYNLVGDDSGCSLTPQANDQVNVDPLLGELQDNGGPTETRALLLGSPAIDAIPMGSCTDHQGRPVTTDQRGVPRPQGAACDVGAYEAVHSALHLPLIVYNYTPPATFPLYIGDTMPERDVAYQGEVFYTTPVQIPGELPSGGHFYFSSQRDTLAEVVVDDELAVLLAGAEVFAYDFSTSGTPVPANVEVPRTTMEQLTGQTVTIEYRDVYGSVVKASTVWLIWTP